MGQKKIQGPEGQTLSKRWKVKEELMLAMAPGVPAFPSWPDMQESLENQSGSSGRGKPGSAMQPPGCFKSDKG